MGTVIMITSPGDLTKEEVRRFLQAIRDIEQGDKRRKIFVSIVVESLKKEDMMEVLNQVTPEVKERCWIPLEKEREPVKNDVV